MSGAIILLSLCVFKALTETNLLCNPDDMRKEYLKNMCFFRLVTEMTDHCSAWIFDRGRFYSALRHLLFGSVKNSLSYALRPGATSL
jgi:hypothetical protein